MLASESHSFVVRVWLEEPADESGPPRWRGQVTHVLDGGGRFVDDLDDVVMFIAGYLSAWGVEG